LPLLLIAPPPSALFPLSLHDALPILPVPLPVLAAHAFAWISHAASPVTDSRWPECLRPAGHRSVSARLSSHGGQLCHRHRACATEPVGILSRAGYRAGVLRSGGGPLRAAQAAAVRYRPVYPGFAGLRPGADPGMAAGGALCPSLGRLWWHGGQPGGGAGSVLADR